jgi:hypothetical protein
MEVSDAVEQKVAEYIFANYPDAPVYFLNGEGNYYVTVYTGLQGVLGTKELHVIAERDADMIEKGSLVIAPWSNNLEALRSDATLLMTDDYYIYQIDE